MSNNHYHIKNETDLDAQITRLNDSTLTYTFNPDGKYGEQHIQVTLLYVTLSKYDMDWISLPHSHTFTEFFYITNGSGKFSIESNIYDVKQNDLIILNPSVIHTEISNPEKPMEYIVLGIDGIQFQGRDKNYIHLNSSTHKSELHHYFKSLALEIKKELPYKDFVCQNLLNIIFTIILRHDSFTISLIEGPKLSRECAIVKEYIDKHFKENITLDDLCSLIHLNKYYFVHNFTKQLGTSPINYIIYKRVEEAKHLLINTNHSLSQIAQILGFSSQSYFSQVFKKFTHQSPKEYKHRYKSSLMSVVSMTHA